MREGELTKHDLVACVTAAVTAPSIHNSQPWRFRIRDGGADVYADRGRQLDLIDPSGREMLMSIGAAVFTLRLALHARAWESRTLLFPDPDDPDLVARVEPTNRTEPDPAIVALADAIPRRHTNRRPFAQIPVPKPIIAELAAAAQLEGTTLRLAGTAARSVVLNLVRIAEERLRAQGVHRAVQVTTVTRTGQPTAVSARAAAAWHAFETLPLRDFGLRQPELRREIDPSDPYPAITILHTAADGPEQWLACGQGLQRILLIATVRGLTATPMSQPLQDPQLRQLLADPDAGPWPQLILQVGYAPQSGGSRRRPLADVLEDA